MERSSKSRSVVLWMVECMMVSSYQIQSTSMESQVIQELTK